jgi:hypothetical protein
MTRTSDYESFLRPKEFTLPVPESGLQIAEVRSWMGCGASYAFAIINNVTTEARHFSHGEGTVTSDVPIYKYINQLYEIRSIKMSGA